MARPKKFDREKVIRCAMNVFWEHGYEAASMSDLTAATGLNPGSIYNSFGNKHALYLETLDYYQQNVGWLPFQALTEPRTSRDAIRSVFDALIDEELGDPARRGCMMQNAIMERAAVDEEVADRACTGREQGKEAFRQVLERGQASGEIRADLNVSATVTHLVGMVYAVRTSAQLTSNREELMAMVDVGLSVME